MDMVKSLKSAGIIPVIVIDNIDTAVPPARARTVGGLPVPGVVSSAACATAAIAREFA